MKRLRVAIPWNLSRYIPRNGFHPLYQALFEDNEHLQFAVLDEVRLSAALQTNDALADTMFLEAKNYAEKSMGKISENKIGRAFINHVTPEELWLTNQIPADIELHHTSPLTLGKRPFVLHCESFLPLFMPFAYQGAGRIRNAEGVRRFFGSLLSSDLCLGIFSHIPDTLQHISSFFRDEKIKEKLHLSRIGLSDRVINVLQSRANSLHIDCPVFLYSNSANQATFALRGGYVALRFAQRYLSGGKNGVFIFRANRPSDADMSRNGIDVAHIRSLEATAIHWLSSFLTEREMLRLFAMANVLLLPSVNLHSVTIMQALAAGAIPVVTDTLGTEHFVTDQDNGIVLKGVRERVWREDPETGIPYDHHEEVASLADSLTDQMYARIMSLLSRPDDFLAIQRRARQQAKERFSGSAFRGDFTERLLALWSKFRKPKPSLQDRFTEGNRVQFELVSERRLELFFNSPPVPTLLIDTGSARLFRCKGVYWLAKQLGSDLDNWSPLALKGSRRLGPQGVQVADSAEDLKEWLIGQPNDFGSRALIKTDRFARQIGRLLRRFPRVYRIARTSYEQLAQLPAAVQKRTIRHIKASSQHADFGPWLLARADPPGWHSQSPPVFPEKIEIDFRARKTFDEIWLLPQEGQPRRAPKEVRIEVSSDRDVWSVVLEINDFFGFNPNGWSSTTMPEPVSARYLKLTILSNNGDDDFVTLTGIRIVSSRSDRLIWPPGGIIARDSLTAW